MEGKIIDIKENLIRTFFEEADVDLQSAEIHLNNKKYHKAVFDAQQCVEKILKAALVPEGFTQVFQHDVSPLFAADVISRSPNDWPEKLREIFY